MDLSGTVRNLKEKLAQKNGVAVSLMRITMFTKKVGDDVVLESFKNQLQNNPFELYIKEEATSPKLASLKIGSKESKCSSCSKKAEDQCSTCGKLYVKAVGIKT